MGRKYNMSLRLRTTLIAMVSMIVVCFLLAFIMLSNVTFWVGGETNLGIDGLFPTTDGQTYGEDYGYFGSAQGSETTEMEQVMHDLSVDLRKLYEKSIWTLLVVLLLGSIVIYFAIGAALKPLDKLKKEISKLDETDLNSRLMETTKCLELDALSHSFNELLQRLEAAFIRERSFSSGAAHELKTPLAIIKTNLDVLNLSEETTPQEYQETFAVVQRQTNRMSRLVDDLFAMCALDGYESNDKIDLMQLLHEIVEEQTLFAKEKAVSLTLVGDIVLTRGNTVMLKHALSNVIANAIKYNVQAGSVNISVVQDHEIRIRIEDTGIGIQEEARAHIFEPFYREDRSRSRNIAGAGLGLSITKNIIEQHGGRITLLPMQTCGTQFELCLSPCKSQDFIR